MAENPPHAPISRLERCVATLGALLVVGMLGFLGRELLAGRDAPAGVRVTVRRVQQVEGGWLVHFEAKNLGTATLADLAVLGQLQLGPGEVEAREVHLDYLPGRSSREGGLYFTQDPQQHALTLVPGSYQRP
jgi:uncharacterized protein (TIGR02588 family)